MEYFIVANSFAAPFVSDKSRKFIEAESPQDALGQFAKEYRHPSGLYFAGCWQDANAYEKGEPALAQWKSNHLLAYEEATTGKGAYSVLGHGPGKFAVDGKLIEVQNPKGGKVTL